MTPRPGAKAASGITVLAMYVSDSHEWRAMMTNKSDWIFRSSFLRDQAKYLRKKAAEFESEAIRFDRLAEQAEFCAKEDARLAVVTVKYDRS
jgi:hypothetical protein